ncbi:AMP-binding protein [bacterium]|nr:AMP-binding protein [bacterium]
MWKLNNFKNNIAVITENGKNISYGELDLYCKKLTDNIKNRCLVFNLCKNEIGSLVGYIGFLNARIVPLMLKADLEYELFHNLLETYKPAYIWLPKEQAKDYNFENVYEDLDYALLKTNFKESYPLNDDLALLLTTSGSTGSPKLVRQSYKNIEANTKSIVEYLHLDETERAITTLPMNYTYGISIINTHLWVGASLMLTDKGLMQKEFWEQFKSYEATSFGGVPYTYEMLFRLRFFRMDLPSLRYMTQAGGKLSPELHEKFAQWAKENNKKFIVMYGQTEATARMSYLPAEMSLEKYGSMGIAIPGGKFSLIDVDGNEITEPETVGELVYVGDNVTLGYATQGDDLIKGDERFGKLVTGDMAKFDKDGFFYIVGRKKRFLKIYGNRVNLDETERLIKAHFTDMECACAGIDDHMEIFITNSDSKNDVINFIADKTGLNRAAFTVNCVNEIPKNEAGKTLYKELGKILVNA